MKDPRKVTRPSEETEESDSRSAVVCARGHLNSPYPSTGQCTECSIFLPGNPHTLKSEDMDEINKRKVTQGKSQEEIACRVLEDEGLPWDEATESLRQLALQFAKSKNVKTLELILQQLSVLKARPKPGEADTELTYEVTLTSDTVENLKRSLADLREMLGLEPDPDCFV